MPSENLAINGHSSAAVATRYGGLSPTVIEPSSMGDQLVTQAKAKGAAEQDSLERRGVTRGTSYSSRTERHRCP